LNEIDSIYGSGIRIAIDQLSSRQLDELSHLPHPLKLNIEGVEILLCHGSPWDLNEYIYPDLSSKTIQKLLLYPYNLIITGHTHYPMLKKIDGINIVNPGSVGQPRNGQKGAQWALFDTADGSINFFVEKYDSTGLAIECKLRHPEIPYLSDVLTR
jgi:putative phosphoesterase